MLVLFYVKSSSQHFQDISMSRFNILLIDFANSLLFIFDLNSEAMIEETTLSVTHCVEIVHNILIYRSNGLTNQPVDSLQVPGNKKVTGIIRL